MLSLLLHHALAQPWKVVTIEERNAAGAMESLCKPADPAPAPTTAVASTAAADPDQKPAETCRRSAEVYWLEDGIQVWPTVGDILPDGAEIHSWRGRVTLQGVQDGSVLKGSRTGLSL